MPSAYLTRLSDFDLEAIVAYVRAAPPVDRVQPAMDPGWRSHWAEPRSCCRRGVAGARASSAAPFSSELSIDTAKYRRYLVDLGNCRVCRHDDLRGGLHPLALPGEPAPPDLHPGGALANWTQADFIRAMTTGRTPDGRDLDPAYMAWPSSADMIGDELAGIWLYLSGARKK